MWRLCFFWLQCIVTVSLALFAFNGPVSAQAPKAIKIVVPFTPGGGSDLLGRILAEHVRQTQSIAAVVENRVGAGSVIGTEAVSRAAPDGTTVSINTPNIVIAPHLRKLSYDPLTSFEPICKLGSSPAPCCRQYDYEVSFMTKQPLTVIVLSRNRPLYL